MCFSTLCGIFDILLLYVLLEQQRNIREQKLLTIYFRHSTSWTHFPIGRFFPICSWNGYFWVRKYVYSDINHSLAHELRWYITMNCQYTCWNRWNNNGDKRKRYPLPKSIVSHPFGGIDIISRLPPYTYFFLGIFTLITG